MEAITYKGVEIAADANLSAIADDDKLGLVCEELAGFPGTMRAVVSNPPPEDRKIIIPGEPQASPVPVRIAVEATHDAVVGTCFFCNQAVHSNTLGAVHPERGMACINCARKMMSPEAARAARVRYCAKGA